MDRSPKILLEFLLEHCTVSTDKNSLKFEKERGTWTCSLVSDKCGTQTLILGGLKALRHFFLLKVFDWRNNRRFSFFFEKIQNLLLYKLYYSLQIYVSERMSFMSHTVFSNIFLKIHEIAFLRLDHVPLGRILWRMDLVCQLKFK
jgi:hypothetical protein